MEGRLRHPDSPGLSPRMRGNRITSVPGMLRAGSIPAYAGEPALDFSIVPIPRVYPRVCGGTERPAFPPGPGSGLSPRMRGNQRHTRRQIVREGSIPAYAGEPIAASRPTPTRQVYPRVCGGTDEFPTGAGEIRGLSPRMRGNPSYACVSGKSRGSIPAYAGEPNQPRSLITRSAVYPRVCGGTRCPPLPPGVVPPWGLSPRMRGNL